MALFVSTAAQDSIGEEQIVNLALHQTVIIALIILQNVLTVQLQSSSMKPQITVELAQLKILSMMEQDAHNVTSDVIAVIS